MPKCFVPINGKPMIDLTVGALRRVGVEEIGVVRGYKGEYFDDAKLGDVTLIDNEDYHSTEVFRSFAASMPFWRKGSGDLYICYSDIVFGDAVIQQLQGERAPMSLVVDRKFSKIYSGRHGHPMEEMEAVTVDKDGKLSRIGKGAASVSNSAHAEFIGLMKVSEEGREALATAVENAIARVSPKVLDQWYLCNLLQMLSDDGVAMHMSEIEGKWREIDTPLDLSRANAAVKFLNDTYVDGQSVEANKHVRSLGLMLRSEANDLKRPLPIVCEEAGFRPQELKDILSGNMEVADAESMLKKVSTTYPVGLESLWVESDDTEKGIRFQSQGDSVASQRTLSRRDVDGSQSPYYVYKDCAMSKRAPFRPELIEQLRTVSDLSPTNPGVVYNNGHLAMQMTLFLGPVNFYYEIDGVKYMREASLGDSNFISPFVKHSFTVRDEPGAPGYPAIVACTYGGNVRDALQDLGRLPRSTLHELSGDLRDVQDARAKMIQRLLKAEILSEDAFAAMLGDMGVSAQRAQELVAGAEAVEGELRAMANVLGVRQRELVVEPLERDEDVVFIPRGAARPHGDSYALTPLARTKHQPDLKSFIVEVDGEGEELRCHLHQFLFNHGTTPVTISWPGGERVMAAGDSAYVAPMIPMRFKGKGEVFNVRIPGRMTKDLFDELATVEVKGKARIGSENLQWY